MRRRGATVYARRALLNPSSFAVALVALIVGALMHHFAVVFFAVVLAALLGVTFAPYIGKFRRVVDDSIDRDERARATAARAELLLRMSDAHRRELKDLERVAGAVREQYGALVHDTLDIDRLLELYVRLAIAHQATTAALEVSAARGPDEVAPSIGAETDEGALVRASLDRRLEVVHRRIDARRAARERQAVLAIELDTIADTVRWMSEACATVHSDFVRSQLRDAFAAQPKDAGTVRELVVTRDEEEIDPEVLRLGRECSEAGR